MRSRLIIPVYVSGSASVTPAETDVKLVVFIDELSRVVGVAVIFIEASVPTSSDSERSSVSPLGRAVCHIARRSALRPGLDVAANRS